MTANTSDTIQELEETLADAHADLKLARADLEQTDDAPLKNFIQEEIEAICEEIAHIEDELARCRALP